jgi:hypothetical protein
MLSYINLYSDNYQYAISRDLFPTLIILTATSQLRHTRSQRTISLLGSASTILTCQLAVPPTNKTKH